MKNAREEERRISEAKYQDIYKRLEELKVALEKKAKNINTELRNFETKFTVVHGKLDEHDN
jgi:hypothetical protein